MPDRDGLGAISFPPLECDYLRILRLPRGERRSVDDNGRGAAGFDSSRSDGITLATEISE